MLNTIEFEKWDDLRPQLAMLFKEKDITRVELMEQGIQLLEDMVGKAGDLTPINFSERFTFIRNNKHNYTAFKQLDELFKETKKKFAGMRARENS
ncbi:YpoC family protein [Psychrobacillus sp. NPDC096426]|uniref:YpoC family protein n=1 Tax=Psychrobacillus sp. NPDC096426 TaxID=3364491 RepID=UPI0038190E19